MEKYRIPFFQATKFYINHNFFIKKSLFIVNFQAAGQKSNPRSPFDEKHWKIRKNKLQVLNFFNLGPFSKNASYRFRGIHFFTVLGYLQKHGSGSWKTCPIAVYGASGTLELQWLISSQNGSFKVEIDQVGRNGSFTVQIGHLRSKTAYFRRRRKYYFHFH